MPGRTEIVAEDAPRGTGAYSQAVRAEGLRVRLRQGPLDPRTLHVRGDTIQEQTEHTLRNVRAIAEAAGGTLGDVVKVSAFLSSIEDFAAFDQTYARIVDVHPRPARTTLLFDLDVMERNLVEMAAIAGDAGVALRPHTKTHKCPEIARMQVDHGARGITVAKLGEAEVMADADFDDLLVAYPIVGESKLRRLRSLTERAKVRVSLDSVEVAEGIGAVGLQLGNPVEVLVEVDTGLQRMGRPPGEPSAALVLDVARVPGVEVVGLLAHAGHAYRAGSGSELAAIAEREAAELLETAERCERGGVPIREISVGSTPTARTVATAAGVSEIRPGTYVFNDVQQMRLGTATKGTCAARVLATERLPVGLSDTTTVVAPGRRAG